MEKCQSGYYSLGGSTTCKFCPAGYQCPTKDVSIIHINFLIQILYIKQK